MIFKVADCQKDYFSCVRVRLMVFVKGQNVDTEIEQDELDDSAIHYVAYDETGKAVGTCRLLIEEDCVHLGRLAVLEEYRNQHVGLGILKAVEKNPIALEKGKIILHAQYHAKGFYEKAGYVAQGEIFYEANMPHVMMVKNL